MKHDKKSRICGILLAAVMAGSLLTGCGITTAGKEDITLIVKCPALVMQTDDKDEVIDTRRFLEEAGAAFAEQYEAANVTFDVMLFDYVDETEAVTGSFDTDHAMDILYEDFFNMTAYVHTGRVVSLDDMITDEIREDIDDTAWAISSLDGKTYMMPFLSRQNIMICNRKLMEECGLGQYLGQGTEIQNWTAEEWTEILDTLAEKLPDGVYPMMMYGKNNQGDTHIMSLIRAFGSEIYDAKGNFNFESPEAVKALTWIQDGVEKGWYPPHPENLEITDNQELFNNNQLVFYVYNNANIVFYDDLEDYSFVNFPGNVATSFVSGFEIFDNGDEAKVQAAKDFIRYIYETDEWLEFSSANIPESKKTAAKYADQIPMFSDFTANASHVVDFMNGSPNWQGDDTSVRSVFWPNIHELLQGNITPEECAASLDEDCNEALRIGRENSTLHE
jgi:multiple sugar transport system substrate-binding protein